VMQYPALLDCYLEWKAGGGICREPVWENDEDVMDGEVHEDIVLLDLFSEFNIR
jgi:hypothetical protein